jgi:hypothetical protein
MPNRYPPRVPRLPGPKPYVTNRARSDTSRKTQGVDLRRQDEVRPIATEDGREEG